MERKELEALVHMALDEASKQGADQAEVGVSIDSGLSATARLGDVENLEYTNDRGIGITVFKDSRKGSASTTDISAGAIREAVTKACTFASVTAQDPASGLADADLMCTDLKDLDLDYPWGIDASEAIAMAIECEARALRIPKARLCRATAAHVPMVIRTASLAAFRKPATVLVALCSALPMAKCSVTTITAPLAIRQSLKA